MVLILGANDFGLVKHKRKLPFDHLQNVIMRINTIGQRKERKKVYFIKELGN